MYSRLYLFKPLASQLPNDPPSFHQSNSVAASLGIPSLPDITDLAEETISGGQYYELLLESCEKLFDNQIEQPAFEDQMRYMFGMKEAYKIFTIDKVIGALIRHVQSWEQDPKLDKLIKLLWDERNNENPTTEDHRNLRRRAEEILGPDENLFRIDWLPDANLMTCQLLNKDGSSLDDAEVLTGRWQSYVESFVSETETKNIPQSKVRRPFLRRNLPRSVSDDSPPDIIARGGLEIKVCVRTYRLFFVSRTEDVLWRMSNLREGERESVDLHTRNPFRERWLERLEAEAKLPQGLAASVV